MKASERKILEMRALAHASAEALMAVAKASKERQAKRAQSKKLVTKAR